jgi:hypothetical protein
MSSCENKPDEELTPTQVKLVEKLTAIDSALLANTCDKWRKVARVVGTTMMEISNQFEGIPDVYYSQRVQKLVKDGYLESQGNLSCMRYSEVRRLDENET